MVYLKLTKYTNLYKFTIFTCLFCGQFSKAEIDQFGILAKSRPAALAQYTKLAAGTCIGGSGVVYCIQSWAPVCNGSPDFGIPCHSG